jgi:hypothetical protein
MMKKSEMDWHTQVSNHHGSYRAWLDSLSLTFDGRQWALLVARLAPAPRQQPVFALPHEWIGVSDTTSGWLVRCSGLKGVLGFHMLSTSGEGDVTRVQT